MVNPGFSFLVEIIGAFVVWTLKGFRGKLTDEMCGPYEYSSKSWRNFAITLIVIFFVVAIIKKLDSSDNKHETNMTKTIILK